MLRRSVVRTALFSGKGCWLAFVRGLCFLCCLVSPHHPKGSDSKSNDYLFRVALSSSTEHSMCECVSMHTCVTQSTCVGQRKPWMSSSWPPLFKTVSALWLTKLPVSFRWCSGLYLPSSWGYVQMHHCVWLLPGFWGSEPRLFDLCGKVFSWRVIFSVPICHLNNLNYFGLFSGDTHL